MLPRIEIPGWAGSWLPDNWRSLGMVAVGLFCLLTLRSMVKSTATAPLASAARADAESFAHPRLHEEPLEAEDRDQPEKMLRRRLEMSGPNLKRELQELVNEDPDAAATILRNWIGDAA